MKTVQLAHGEEVVVLVKVTLLSLDHLIKDNPIGFYELVMKCRDPQHSIWGDQQGKLQELSLVQPDGRVHQSIRNVVLSSVQGDGLEMVLTSPL
jgi:hypothetical protein